MKKPNHIVLIALITALGMTLTGCANDKKIEELEKRIEYLESLHQTDSTTSDVAQNYLIEQESIPETANAEYLKAEAIDLLYDYDTQKDTWTGEYYQLRIWGDKSTFTYYGEGSYDPIYCDFSLNTYYELLNMICVQQVEKYENQTDSNGKILYETVPRMLKLFLNASDGSVCIKEPENMDAIIARFKELKESAIQ